jgi:hypothetical protein
MDFVKMLYTIHANFSNIDKSPFPHIKDFSKEKIDYELINTLKNEDELTNFSTSCFEQFKLAYPSTPFGSVHYNHLTWTEFAYNTIVKRINDASESNTISYPNACCTKTDCPINLFYDIVHAKIFTK